MYNNKTTMTMFQHIPRADATLISNKMMEDSYHNVILYFIITAYYDYYYRYYIIDHY